MLKRQLRHSLIKDNTRWKVQDVNYLPKTSRMSWCGRRYQGTLQASAVGHFSDKYFQLLQRFSFYRMAFLRRWKSPISARLTKRRTHAISKHVTSRYNFCRPRIEYVMSTHEFKANTFRNVTWYCRCISTCQPLYETNGQQIQPQFSTERSSSLSDGWHDSELRFLPRLNSLYIIEPQAAATASDSTIKQHSPLMVVGCCNVSLMRHFLLFRQLDTAQ